MSDILFNKEGIPLLGFGKKAFFTTTGMPGIKAVTPDIPKADPEDTSFVKKYETVSWGDNNSFPQDAEETINKTGVLNSGLKFMRNFTIGQGIFAVKIKGYDDKGNEILEVVNDPSLNSFIASRMVRRYMEKSLRDYLKFGLAFPQLLPNADGSKIVGINTVNALYCRYVKANNGVIDRCIVSGDWPDSPKEGNIREIAVLDDYDPYDDLDRRRIIGKVGRQSFIYPLKDSWSNNDYYPFPIWWSAKLAGWIDVANKVPTFLKKAYDNQISWMWHVKIPYAYWDKRYPKENYKDEAVRQAAIQTEMDEIEENLTSEENANKALFTMFEIGPTGKAEEQWIIERLDNVSKEADKLFTSAAANSEILFALLINPNVMGAGMPGGTYAGNQGGSNIREAFLINLANAWLDRQNVMDPLELYLRYNGLKDVELRFRNTILTTLDTGSGTDKILS